MKFLKSFGLLFVAVVLISTMAIPSILCSIVMVFVQDTRKRYGVSSLLFALAWAIDVLGNVLCADLFNVILIKHGGYRFGEVGETVSSVLGVNKMNGTLSKTGEKVAALLGKIDPDHCIKSAKAYHEKTRVKPY